MQRSILIIVVAGLTLVVALGWMYHRTSDAADQRAAEYDQTLNAIESQLAEVTAETEHLQEVIENLEEENQRLRRRLADAETASARRQQDAEGREALASVFEGFLSSLADSGAHLESINERDGDDEGSAEREARRQQWEERRSDFMATARENMNAMLDESAANADTLDEQERLVALKENLNHMMNLYSEARQIENEQDREAYRDAIQQTRRNIRDLVNEQQSDMLRDVAEQHGITDPEQQQAFLDAMEEAQRSPYFSSPMLSQGVGGGGRRGGPPQR